MNKKRGLVFGALIFGILLISPVFVSAASNTAVEDIWNGATDVLETILRPVFGPADSGGLLFTKVLFFIIILAIVWTVLGKVPLIKEYTWVVSIVAIAVGILSTRFLVEPGWVVAILLPYSVLGVALTAFLPLIIFFFFVEEALHGKTTLKKIAWIFAAVVFIGLFISRLYEFKDVEFLGGFNPSWIYLISAVLCFVFLLLDKTIQAAWARIRTENIASIHKHEMIMDIRAKLKIVHQRYADNLYDSEEAYKRDVKRLQNQIIELSK